MEVDELHTRICVVPSELLQDAVQCGRESSACVQDSDMFGQLAALPQRGECTALSIGI